MKRNQTTRRVLDLTSEIRINLPRLWNSFMEIGQSRRDAK